MLVQWSAVVAFAAIVMIAPANASTGDACAAPPPALTAFAPSTGTELAPAPAFLEDGTVPRSFADYRGQALVVNFWATWCPPCVVEMPALDRLAEAVDADGITVIALSADRGGAAAVRQFYEVNALSHLRVFVDERMSAARALDVAGLPTTILIDRAGREVGRVRGVAEWDAPETIAFLRLCLDKSER